MSQWSIEGFISFRTNLRTFGRRTRCPSLKYPPAWSGLSAPCFLRRRETDGQALASSLPATACPKCQGSMRIISFIEEQSVIRAILEHPGLWLAHARPPPKAHAPPIRESKASINSMIIEFIKSSGSRGRSGCCGRLPRE